MQKHGMTEALIVVALVGISAFALLSHRANSSNPSEPRYQGIILSEWLCPSKKPGTWGMGAWGPHREAILHIGTNAIPLAIRWMQYREPAGQFNPRIDKNYMLAIASVDVFEILGTNASGAISELTRLLNNTNQSELTIGCVTRSLSYLGPDAYPPLIAVLTNQQNSLQVRNYAAIDIARNGVNTNAMPAIPFLINELSNTDKQFAAQCALSLGYLGLQPEIVVPALTKALGDPSPDVRRWAAVGLGCFGTNAISALPAIQALLNDPANLPRYDISNAMENIQQTTSE